MEEKREIIYSDISSASRKNPCDAMVYLEGTSVIAVDSNGKVIAKGTAGTDDATVIQAAIDSLTTGKGTLHIHPGTYTITQTLTLDTYFAQIIGYGATFVRSGNFVLLEVTNSPYAGKNTTIRGILFDGGNEASYIVHVNGALMINFEQCRFANNGTDAIYVERSSWGVTLIGNYVSNIAGYFLKTGGINPEIRCMDNVVYRSNGGFYVAGSVSVNIIGNECGDMNPGSGVCIFCINTYGCIIGNNIERGGGTRDVHGIRIESFRGIVSGNRVYDIGVSWSKFPFYIAGTNWLTFTGNYAEECPGQVYIDASTTGLKFYNNHVTSIVVNATNSDAARNDIYDSTVYISRAKGTATLLNTTTAIVVAHGCSATPTNITVTPGSIGNATKWYVDTIDATNFTIRVDQDPGVDITFYWRAEV